MTAVASKESFRENSFVESGFKSLARYQRDLVVYFE